MKMSAERNSRQGDLATAATTVTVIKTVSFRIVSASRLVRGDTGQTECLVLAFLSTIVSNCDGSQKLEYTPVEEISC